MTTRNMSMLFQPASVALIGASERDNSVGSVITKNLQAMGFPGTIYPVNPRYKSVHGLTSYANLDDLPATPDLAIVATPPNTVPQIISELGNKGTKSAVVITAGFGEGGHAPGMQLRQQMLDAANPHLLRIVGPNCLGIIMPHTKLNASFGIGKVKPGHIAFATQSGAMATTVLDWAHSKNIGFSHVLTLGDMTDVDFGDTLDYLATNPLAKSILLYVEHITHARKFMSAARAAARTKPVVVIKSGRFAEGAKAAASHTGALAGADAVYEAAFRRAGMLRVYELDELFESVETLSKMHLPKGDRLTIVSNGGGAGVLATDALIERGGRLSTLSETTVKQLDKVLPPTWSRANPIDLIGDANAERYADALEIVLASPETDAVLVLNCPTAILPGDASARATVHAAEQSKKSIVTGWLGGDAAEPARAIFAKNGLPSFDTPDRAVRAFMHMVDYARNQEALRAVPPSVAKQFTPQKKIVHDLIHQALHAGSNMLSERHAKQVFEAYGIPTAQTHIAKTPDDAARLAGDMSFPVVIKIHSKDISHKSDVGGVVLGLVSSEDVRTAAQRMLSQVAKQRPDASIEGIAVQEMVTKKNGRELIIGMSEDHQFGPILMFGEGGKAVETIADTAIELPPLDMSLAKRMVERTRIAKRLASYRDCPAADSEGIALTLVRISQLITDFSEIKELDINPLIADENGVVALDGRIRVATCGDHPHRRLAIKPYPNEFEENVTFCDGTTLRIRPVKAEDGAALAQTFSKLTDEEIRFRFHSPMAAISPRLTANLSQINYDREIGLVVTADGQNKVESDIFALASFVADPNNDRAEYAILVRHDMTGRGIGRTLMGRLIRYAKARRLNSLYGYVLSENNRMLDLCRHLGFEILQAPDEPGVMLTELHLGHPLNTSTPDMDGYEWNSWRKAGE